MTSLLIIEDGSGVLDANSYISTDDANAYLDIYEDAGYDSAWPSAVEDQERALLIGCQALEWNYRDQWLSTRRIPVANELTWPRFPFYDRNSILVNDRVIPKHVGWAQTTLALYYVQGVDLFPQEPKDSHIIEQTDKVGELMTSTKYTAGAPYEVFRKINRMLWHITIADQVSNLLR
jgi:hypothetical protein